MKIPETVIDEVTACLRKMSVDENVKKIEIFVNVRDGHIDIKNENKLRIKFEKK